MSPDRLGEHVATFSLLLDKQPSRIGSGAVQRTQPQVAVAFVEKAPEGPMTTRLKVTKAAIMIGITTRAGRDIIIIRLFYGQICRLDP